MDKYTRNSSKGCVLEVELGYPRELHKLQNDYPLAPDKIEIKREMLPECQRKIADLYNISIGSVKKLVPTLFHKEKYVIHYEENTTLLETRIKTKKMHRVSEFSQWQWLKPYI